MAAAHVTVLVASGGESPLLERTLEELRRQAVTAGAELLLVLNRAETDLEEARRSRLEALADRLLFAPEPGKSHALNLGFREARGALVACTDDDALPAPGWLAALLAPFAGAGPELAGTGGRVWPVFPPAGPPAWYRPLLAGARTSFLGPWHDLGAEEQDYPNRPDRLPVGANWCLRREAVLPDGFRVDLGPNRATGLRGGEDTELALRLLARGLRLRYCPRAVVHHPVTPERLDEDFVAAAFFQQGREAVLLARAIGRPLPLPGEVRRRLRREGKRWFLRALRGDPRRHRYRFRRHFQQGRLAALEELRS